MPAVVSQSFAPAPPPRFLKARDAGLEPSGKTKGGWWCSLCGVEVLDWNLEDHVASQKHKRYQEWEKEAAAKKEAFEAGLFASWMSLRNGEEYCTLCSCPATEGHLISRRHANKQWWHERNQEAAAGSTSPPPPADAAAGGSDAPPPPPPAYPIAAASASPAAPVELHFPVGFGKREWFEIRNGDWWCALCWKVADDNHVGSAKHQRKVAWVEAQ